MNYANIKYCDIANGTGVRTSLFVSGCTHHCRGCFNEIAWDFGYGEGYTDKTQEEILKSIEPDYVTGLSLLGGEPVNQRVLVGLCREFRERFPDKTIWCYTGYTLESDLQSPQGRARCEVTDELLSYIDVLVDGEFIEREKDLSLMFRGIRNQRLIALSGREIPPADRKFGE